MRIELELWHLLLMLFTVVGAFWAMAKMLIESSNCNVADKFAALTQLITGQSALIRTQGDEVRRIERDLLGLRAELPRDYVRREDYTTAIATITIKIDHATLLMQTAVRDAYAQAFKALGAAHPPKDAP